MVKLSMTCPYPELEAKVFITIGVVMALFLIYLYVKDFINGKFKRWLRVKLEQKGIYFVQVQDNNVVCYNKDSNIIKCNFDRKEQ